MGAHVWDKIPDGKRQDLLQKYKTLNDRDAQALGMNLPTLKRRLREYRSRNLRPLAPSSTRRQQPPANDKEVFECWVKQLKKNIITVMHLCDIHYPYQHTGALRLALEIVRRVQPDIVVIGSDEFDFMRLGRFDVDPRTGASELDDLDLVRADHQQLVDDILKQSPSSKLVWIYGNHDYRLYKHILQNSPNLAKTVAREFVEMIRYQGRVWHIGEVDRVIVRNVLIGHGTKAGTHPAKGNMDSVGGSIHYMAGHVHRLSHWFHVGYRGTYQSITSGCLCQLTPIYQGYKQDMSKWQLGTAIAHISKDVVKLDNLEFFEADDKIKTILNGEIIVSP